MTVARSDATTLVTLLQRRAATQGPVVGYRYLDHDLEVARSLTYCELHRGARAVAAGLASAASPGDRVLVAFPTGPDFLVAFFGCLYAGMVAVPVRVPGRRGMDEFFAVADDCGAAVALAEAAVRREVRDAADRLDRVLACRTADAGPSEGPAAEFGARPEDLAYLQYTSGSTTRPAGVRVTHANVTENLAFIHEAQANDARSVGATWLPHSHDMGLVEGLLAPLFGGYPAYVLKPTDFLQRPARWLEMIGRYAATNSGGPNFAYRLCIDRVTDAEAAGLSLATWRFAYNGAEPIRFDTVAGFTARFGRHGFDERAWRPSYGLAEATLMVTTGGRGEPPAVLRLDPEELARGVAIEAGDGVPVVSSGELTEAVPVAVVDPETLAECPPGRIGELWVTGPCVTRGYWGAGDRSSGSFAALRSRPGRTFFRTGDLGFVADGRLYVTGRRKDVMIIRGRNVFPQDLEAAAAGSHPALAPDRGAAFVAGDESEDLVLVHEVRREARGGELGSVAAAAREEVSARFGLSCAAVVLIRPGALPLTGSGKVRRGLCRERYLTGGLDALYVWRRPSPHMAAEFAALTAGDGGRP